MADSTYIFETGDAIDVGEHGDHDYVFASGTPVNDSGVSPFVFESGTGLGLELEIIANGTNVGYYETNEFYKDFVAGNLDAGGEWGYTGAEDAGIVDNVCSGCDHFAFVHHDTKNDVWAVGYITNQDTSVVLTHQGSADFFINIDPPYWKEDEASGADFGTDADGDAQADLITGGAEGDSVAYDFPLENHTITVDQDTESSEPDPSGLDFVGPKARVAESFPAAIDVEFKVG